MTKTVLYLYLGTNGSILSPVHLEDVYYVRRLELEAAPGYVLRKGQQQAKSIVIPEEELTDWSEVKDLGQE